MDQKLTAVAQCELSVIAARSAPRTEAAPQESVLPEKRRRKIADGRCVVRMVDRVVSRDSGALQLRVVGDRNRLGQPT
jgi:hypothetical protein